MSDKYHDLNNNIHEKPIEHTGQVLSLETEPNKSKIPIDVIHEQSYKSLEKIEDDKKSWKSGKSGKSSKKSNLSDYQMLFKIILIGDSGIGKTSIINKYINNIFTDKHLCTIGVDFMMKTLKLKNTNVKLQVWDTAGMERYRQITTSYYRGANAAIICFDINSKKTFINLKIWINAYYEYSNANLSKVIVIVGNKSDLEREVTEEDIDEFLKINPSFVYFECSAKNGAKIDEVFEYIASKLIEVSLTCKDEIFENKAYKSISTSDFKLNIKKKKCCK